MDKIPSLVEVVSLLAQGVGAGFVLAFLAEKSGWFQKLSSRAKSWWIFGLSVGLPIVAQLLLQFVPANVWDILQPYWYALAAGFVSWAGSQVAYLGVIKKSAARVWNMIGGDASNES